MKILLAEDDGAGNVFCRRAGNALLRSRRRLGRQLGQQLGLTHPKKARGSAVPTTAKEREGGAPAAGASASVRRGFLTLRPRRNGLTFASGVL